MSDFGEFVSQVKMLRNFRPPMCFAAELEPYSVVHAIDIAEGALLDDTTGSATVPSWVSLCHHRVEVDLAVDAEGGLTPWAKVDGRDACSLCNRALANKERHLATATLADKAAFGEVRRWVR
jgi:hypothetical protein